MTQATLVPKIGPTSPLQDPSVILTEVDLNDRTLWPWLGDWRSRIWREGPARQEGK